MRTLCIAIILILLTFAFIMNILYVNVTNEWNHFIWVPTILTIGYVFWVEHIKTKEHKQALEQNKRAWIKISKNIDLKWILENGLISTKEVNGVPISSVSHDAWIWLVNNAQYHEYNLNN